MRDQILYRVLQESIKEKMIGLIIWSKDRPAQLDLLLQSVKKYCPNVFGEIHVIYKYSNELYREGYIKCVNYHSIESNELDVFLYKEDNLAKNTKESLSYFNYCAVSTDDTVFFDSFSLDEEVMSDVDVFSLRLGKNTIIQNPFDNSIQPALTQYTEENGFLTWDFRLHHPNSNYGYPFGFDGHVYNTERLLSLIKDVDFKSINELESYLFHNCRDKINPFIRSFTTSKCVNLPVNNTSGITETNNSNPLQETNRLFLDGKRFRLKEVEESNIIGCHQLIGLVME